MFTFDTAIAAYNKASKKVKELHYTVICMREFLKLFPPKGKFPLNQPSLNNQSFLIQFFKGSGSCHNLHHK